jgi:hypothetical protein
VNIESALNPVCHHGVAFGPLGPADAERRMLTTRHKRFVWAREQRFPDYFSEFSIFRVLLKDRRPAKRSAQEPMRERPTKKRWKPAPWTPWLWMK